MIDLKKNSVQHEDNGQMKRKRLPIRGLRSMSKTSTV
nr:hypothetical protein [uncultured Eisenbergiella sp.]